MRFSCTIADQGSVENVSRYFRTVASICRHKIGMKISGDFIELHSAETVKNGGHSLTLKFDANNAFSTYAFQPFSEDIPFIMLEIEIKKLADIFHTAKGHVRWKLFNKPNGTGLKKPHFLVQMRESHCSHHIPVQIVSEKRWEAYERQPVGVGQHLVMPSVRAMFRTLQQFKASQARFVLLTCDEEGKFSLAAQLEQARTVVSFSDCVADANMSAEVEPFRTKLNIRSLLTCFGGILACHCNCSLNVISERVAEIQVKLPEAEISFVIGTVLNE